MAVHDEELLRMKSLYEAAQPILEDLEKWKRNWALYQEFEVLVGISKIKITEEVQSSCHMCNCFCVFRGRQQIQLDSATEEDLYSERVKTEPKCRNCFQRSFSWKNGSPKIKLPFTIHNEFIPLSNSYSFVQLEEELRGRVEDWEKNKSSPFLVHGQRVMDYISSQWEEHRQQKDKEKNERVSLFSAKGKGLWGVLLVVYKTLCFLCRFIKLEIGLLQMTKKAETSQFKTPTKRALGLTCTTSTPTPSKKVKKVIFVNENIVL